MGGVPGGWFSLPRDIIRAVCSHVYDMAPNANGELTFCCGGELLMGDRVELRGHHIHLGACPHQQRDLARGDAAAHHHQGALAAHVEKNRKLAHGLASTGSPGLMPPSPARNYGIVER